MAKGNTANEAKKDMLVSGVCEFYGQTDNYDGDGKEYKLCIKDPEFKHLDWDVIESWYTDKKGNVKLPKLYKDLKEGVTPDKVYFKSSNYPITRVSVYNKEDKTIKSVEVSNPQLKDMTILMKLNKLYIGAIMTDAIPEEFHPTAFADADELGDDLPF